MYFEEESAIISGDSTRWISPALESTSSSFSWLIWANCFRFEVLTKLISELYIAIRSMRSSHCEHFHCNSFEKSCFSRACSKLEPLTPLRLVNARSGRPLTTRHSEFTRNLSTLRSIHPRAFLLKLSSCNFHFEALVLVFTTNFILKLRFEMNHFKWFEIIWSYQREIEDLLWFISL